jgi:LmbE family N-acetylglucosaminyl deacetylase
VTNSDLRVLVLGAHPDDAEYHSGGLLSYYSQRGATLRLVSVTNGGAGHHQMDSSELVSRRRQEAAEAGRTIGAEYLTWDYPDGLLEPTLDLRLDIIREIRTFQPDLLLTHRSCDYHPDHRAVGQVVQDASYMVTVPLILPETPALAHDPVVAYMPDTFSRPAPLRADVVLPIDDYLDSIVQMLACHESQFFEFLPHNMHFDPPLPDDRDTRVDWLRQHYCQMLEQRRDRFDQQLVDQYGADAAAEIRYIEVFEISEYARSLDQPLRRTLFPFTT